MNRTIPILIFIVVIAIGFIDYLIKLIKINDKLKLTTDYKDKFVEYCNSLFNNNFNQELYNYLTENVNRMQIELGDDVILAYMQDHLKGVAARNYQLLINTLLKTDHLQITKYMVIKFITVIIFDYAGMSNPWYILENKNEYYFEMQSIYYQQFVDK